MSNLVAVLPDLTGNLEDSISELTGYLEDSVPVLKGFLSDDVTYASYEGDYKVTPLLNYDFELKTKNKVLKDNVTVKRIPYQEIPNSAGGMTVYIGEV